MAMAKHVLIIEDDPDFATSLELALDLLGMQACRAGSAEEAYALLDSGSFDISLGFFDVKLPGDDGITCLQKIIRSRPKMTGIVMTGFRDNALVQRATAAGADAVLLKPFRMAEFMELVTKYVS